MEAKLAAIARLTCHCQCLCMINLQQCIDHDSGAEYPISTTVSDLTWGYMLKVSFMDLLLAQIKYNL